MSPESWIAIAAMIISVLTFVASQIGQKKLARKTYVQDLEDRLKECEKCCKQCKEEKKDLIIQNHELMAENRELRKKLSLC